MDDLPLHLLEKILFRLEPKSLTMMQRTNKSIKSYITDPRFESEYSLSIRPYLFHLPSIGDNLIYCMPFISSCDPTSPGNEGILSDGTERYIFGSCSGLLLLYIGGLFIANPLTKRFRILDHLGSKLLSKIVSDVDMVDRYDPNAHLSRTERAMCIGFAVDRTTKRFNIVCILEMETVYGFEISDGDSWRLSETTITTSSKSDLTMRMKPVYVEGNLYWLRNDGSLVAFNPETEQAHLIPSFFQQKPDMKLLFAANGKTNLLALISGTKETISVYTLLGNHKWELARRIKNVSMDERKPRHWDVVAYDGKCLVVREKKMGCVDGVVHVYDMEANSWGVLGSIRCWCDIVRDFYKLTPSLLSVEEDEQPKVIVASDDQRILELRSLMGLIDTTK